LSFVPWVWCRLSLSLLCIAEPPLSFSSYDFSPSPGPWATPFLNDKSQQLVPPTFLRNHLRPNCGPLDLLWIDLPSFFLAGDDVESKHCLAISSFSRYKTGFPPRGISLFAFFPSSSVRQPRVGGLSSVPPPLKSFQSSFHGLKFPTPWRLFFLLFPSSCEAVASPEYAPSPHESHIVNKHPPSFPPFAPVGWFLPRCLSRFPSEASSHAGFSTENPIERHSSAPPIPPGPNVFPYAPKIRRVFVIFPISRLKSHFDPSRAGACLPSPFSPLITLFSGVAPLCRLTHFGSVLSLTRLEERASILK